MNNFNIVFSAIKVHCRDTGTRDSACYNKLAAMLEDRQDYLTLNTYLEILENLGLIKFTKRALIITLTEKGKKTDSLFAVKENSAG
ncbi:MAG: hypothetical protein JWQ38_3808 [Flavipsychrobacter sp.]|nr:hypothetical protein [Flavipsychrobacter sp.]